MKKIKKQFIYQFALRRADNEKKQFIIERETVYTDTKITEEQAYAISQKYGCDVQIVFLGILTPAKKEEIINKEFHSKELIQEYLEVWKTPIEEIKEVTKDGTESIQ